MEWNCTNCDTRIVSNSPSAIFFEWIICPVCGSRCDAGIKKVEPEPDIPELPWACCGGKIPAGDKCPICGDKE